MKLAPHFALVGTSDRFLPDGMAPDDVPYSVLDNLTRLCVDLLEPLRVAMLAPVHVHSAWRDIVANRDAGGVKDSDHLLGRAADIHIGARGSNTWEDMTFKGFHWLREFKDGDFGQLILEDHRLKLADSGKLWIHVSTPSTRHTGLPTDAARVLVSYGPGEYQTYAGEQLA